MEGPLDMRCRAITANLPPALVAFSIISQTCVNERHYLPLQPLHLHSR